MAGGSHPESGADLAAEALGAELEVRFGAQGLRRDRPGGGGQKIV
jgi:hypothetical protein